MGNLGFNLRLYLGLGLAALVISCADASLSGKSGVAKAPPPVTNNALPAPDPASPLVINSVTVNDNIGRIVCTKTDFYSDVAEGPADKYYTLTFTAAECGGKLPNNEFIGFSVDEEICGADREWTVLEPRAGTLGSPGVKVHYLGHCPAAGRSGSKVTVAWIHQDSAKVAGEASAASPAELLTRITARTASLLCRKTNFNPGTATTSGAQSFAFAATECTGGGIMGRLPTQNHVGFLTKRQVCGLNESWTQPIQAAPGTVAFWYLGSIQPCTNSNEVSDIQAVYINR